MKCELTPISAREVYNSKIGYISKGCIILNSMYLIYIYNKLKNRKVYNNDKIESFSYDEKLNLVFHELSLSSLTYVIDTDIESFFTNFTASERLRIINKLKYAWIPEHWRNT